jgi:F-type H+-transporting ATPase subunit delta
MAGELTTIARPYAEAVFDRAEESNSLDSWSEALALLAAIIDDRQIAGIVANPQVPRASKAELLLDIGGDALAGEPGNLTRLLAANGRLDVVPEIARLFETLKSESQGTLDVHVLSAYAVNSSQEKQLSDALSAKLGRQVNITSEKDPSLIAGVIIRAGDLVIDGSIKGQLANLASELGI